MTLDDIQEIVRPYNDKLIAEGRAAKLEAENKRLRAALHECAADYKSPPCTVISGASHLSHEFSRRMQIAYDALQLND